MRIASQNVAKRLSKSGKAIIDAVGLHEPDVIALQEVTLRQLDGWCELLVASGYSHIVRGSSYGTRGGALLGSRLPIEPVRLTTSTAAAPRVAAGVVDGISVASIYFPDGQGAAGWSSLYEDILLQPRTRDFILIGDFQMVVAEIEISSGTFPKWRRDPSFVAMQSMLGHWRDAFRVTNGPDRIAFSHQHNSGARWLNDHAFVPPTLQVVSCDIDWSPIEKSLSDHATLLLDVEVKNGGSRMP